MSNYWLLEYEDIHNLQYNLCTFTRMFFVAFNRYLGNHEESKKVKLFSQYLTVYFVNGYLDVGSITWLTGYSLPSLNILRKLTYV